MSIRQKFKLLVLLLFGSLAIGCDAFSPPEASFVVREETKDLTGDVADAVEEQLEGSFGTPHALVAWLKLPIDYGGIPGATEESELEGPLNKFPVTFDAEADDVFLAQFQSEDGEFEFGDGGTRLDWMTGENVGQTMHVIGFDDEKKLLVTKEKMDIAPAAGDTFVLSAGDKLKAGRALYMEHCMHCHGVSGDGNGPTAPYLNPRPRDYRLGEFKFKSTLLPVKIRQDDLSRIIKYGIPGTYMPSFLLLENDELGAIVEYVRWLAMRGELEYKVDQEMILAEELSDEKIDERIEKFGESQEEIQTQIDDVVAGMAELFDSQADDLAQAWEDAEEEDALIVPSMARVPDSFESRARGRKFYLKNCTNCHGHMGRGNGAMTEDFQENEQTKEKYPEPGLYDIWENPIKPRNLTKGLYRGGRRPIDLYRRIHSGIKPSKMPGFATNEVDNPTILWDTVNYVLHIPFEKPGEYLEVDEEYRREKEAAGVEEPKTADQSEDSPETKQTAIESTESSDRG